MFTFKLTVVFGVNAIFVTICIGCNAGKYLFILSYLLQQPEMYKI